MASCRTSECEAVLRWGVGPLALGGRLPAASLRSVSAVDEDEGAAGAASISRSILASEACDDSAFCALFCFLRAAAVAAAFACLAASAAGSSFVS